MNFFYFQIQMEFQIIVQTHICFYFFRYLKIQLEDSKDYAKALNYMKRLKFIEVLLAKLAFNFILIYYLTLKR